MSLVQDPGRVSDLAAAMAAGKLSSVALVERCLARIREVDAQVQAWIHVLEKDALEAAHGLDRERAAGKVRGPLHGIPVAIKDIIDVKGLPTRANSASRAEIAPAIADATLVAHLRAAGAVILGKVHTTEYAYFESVPPTRNPHDLTRTPGGSSGGSAAAVASGTVPLAIGTQTAGSVNRPAAYCGIGAFKPSTLSVSGAGILPLAPTFDTPGAFGYMPQDAVALAAAFAPDHLGLYALPSTATMRVVVLQDPMLSERTKTTTATAISALAARCSKAGIAVGVRASPVSLADVVATHRLILLAELGRAHAKVPRDKVAPRLAADMDNGLAMPEADYIAALMRLKDLRRAFWAGFAADEAILMPAAPDVAPHDGTTGDPSYVIPTTALGGPVVSLNAGFCAENKMPVGALLFARPGADAALASFTLGRLSLIAPEG
ncbi:MAG: amidase [Hyphomicrobiales bacterium]|nr:MAG: amidase [Hyphomicrobiales bacterium]